VENEKDRADGQRDDFLDDFELRVLNS